MKHSRSNFFKRTILLLIRLYQHTISLDHGPLRRLTKQPRCKFYPTCSEYAHQAIERFDILRGGFLAAKRFFHCHPWTVGGIDIVPKE